MGQKHSAEGTPRSVEAVRMLRQELVKQPDLSIWFTAEEWKMDLEPFLVSAGYLGPERDMNGCRVRDVLPKAKELLHAPSEH